MNGDSSSHCNFDFWTKQFYPCAEENIHCGMLQCNVDLETSPRLPGGSSRMTYGNENCRSLKLDYSADSPNYAPKGAKCGEGKMCLNRKCLPVESIKIKCADCHGNGVCNTRGHCHCFEGWAPPFCDEPGNGGSVDDGADWSTSCKTNFWYPTKFDHHFLLRSRFAEKDWNDLRTRGFVILLDSRNASSSLSANFTADQTVSAGRFTINPTSNSKANASTNCIATAKSSQAKCSSFNRSVQERKFKSANSLENNF